VNACDRFVADLDALGADGESAAHAATCPRCARALAAARAIEAQLAGTPATAPSGFTERVMARVRADAAPAPARVAPRAFADVLPEWVRLAAEPRIAGALVLAALVMAYAPRLLTLGRGGLLVAAGWLAGGAANGLAPVTRPLAALAATDNLRLALTCGTLTTLMLLAVPLYRWSERLAGRRRH
jgi:hypothetical protein